MCEQQQQKKRENSYCEDVKLELIELTNMEDQQLRQALGCAGFENNTSQVVTWWADEKSKETTSTKVCHGHP